jgi:hypothetical protein
VVAGREHSRPVASWWAPIDVSAWTDYAPETRGPRRPKLWLKAPDGTVWLRKLPPPPDPARPHTARRSEPAIEVLALELARRCGIDVADTRPATWGGERGIVSRRFHDDDEQHHPGAELMGLPGESGSDSEARRMRDQGRASATLARVRDELRQREQEHGVALLQPFTRILALDAWLGNGDRHSGNWALITGPHGARLAPMYDPTACLGVELTDERAELAAPTPETIDRYVRRCPSGFGGGAADGRTGVPMVEVLAELGGWPEWPAAIAELLPHFTRLTEEVVTIIDTISDEWLSPARKAFVSLVLRRRVRLFMEG